MSAKRLSAALTERGIDPESLSGVFVTHEHGDHIAGVRVFCSKYNIPLFATRGTLEILERDGHINGKFKTVELDYGEIELDGYKIKNFRTSHDSAESCGYKVELPDGRKAAVCTDLGFVSEEVKKALCKTDLLVFESNHDIDMLKTGIYPYSLKQRIMSPHRASFKRRLCRRASAFCKKRSHKDNSFPFKRAQQPPDLRKKSGGFLLALREYEGRDGLPSHRQQKAGRGNDGFLKENYAEYLHSGRGKTKGKIPARRLCGI